MMATKITAPGPSSKDNNINSNTYTIPSMWKSKETGLSLDPGGVTQDTSNSDNSYLSSYSSVSYIEIDKVM